MLECETEFGLGERRPRGKFHYTFLHIATRSPIGQEIDLLRSISVNHGQKCDKALFPAEDCVCVCEVGYCQFICRCTVGLLEEYNEGLMLGGQVLDDFDLAGGDALSVQQQNGGSMVLFDSVAP